MHVFVYIADDMGLGKSIQCLGLILANPPPGVRYSPIDDEKGIPIPTNTTLIVCPMTVLYAWQQQIANHLHENSLSYAVYHGPNRHMVDLNVDIVLTTYDVVAQEYDDSEKALSKGHKKQKSSKINSPLFATKFYRIILDEGTLLLKVFL
jgi:SNF2 family DNA or RNA helicase